MTARRIRAALLALLAVVILGGCGSPAPCSYTPNGNACSPAVSP